MATVLTQVGEARGRGEADGMVPLFVPRSLNPVPLSGPQFATERRVQRDDSKTRFLASRSRLRFGSRRQELQRGELV